MTGQDLGSALTAVEKLIRDSVKTSVLNVPGEPAGHYYLIKPDGTTERAVAAPAWHGEKLATPGHFKAFVRAHPSKGGAMFYDEGRIVYVYDENDRRDVAACVLTQSPQYQWCVKPQGAMSQPDFVRLLRIGFRGCLSADSALLPLVRNLRFTSGADTDRDVQHGRESLGKLVTAQVTGVDTIPEDVTLSIPVFENHTFRARVACAIEVLPHEQAFRLTPYPLEVRRAMDEAMEDISDLLEGDDMPPAFRGQPQ